MKEFDPRKQLMLGLKAIAVARLLRKDVNIASTTALQALDPEGRKLGLLAGANVIMPNLTEHCRRSGYQLYQGKPGINDDSSYGLEQLQREITEAGCRILWNEWGDSLHYFSRRKP
jgi:biotin synthase